MIRRKILQAADQAQPRLLDSLMSLTAIASVSSLPVLHAPYGPAIRQALDQVLQLAENMGFETENVADIAGIVSLPGSCQEDSYIGVFAHLDVVKAGPGWSSPPFEPIVRGGRLYGRGVLDNKGPALACLYALQVLKELGFVPRHEIRLVFGTHEESGMDDMALYLQHKKPPVTGFTPDCKFPVVYAERGRLVLEIQTADQVFVQKLLDAPDPAQVLGIGQTSPIHGPVQVLKTVYKKPRLELHIAFIPQMNEQDIISVLKKQLPAASIRIKSSLPVVHRSPKSRPARIMQQAYEEVTGQAGAPAATSGGTYAKIVANIYPFGPSFPGQKGIAHLPDEWLDLEDLRTMTRIYALALYDLGMEETL